MQQKPKHQKIRTWFNLAAPPRKPFVIDGVKRKSITVRPFNGEAARNGAGPGWSHGFAHYKVLETGQTGGCGTQYFEDNATPLQKPRKPTP